MTNKYIIKNCPSYTDDDDCDCVSFDVTEYKCQDCTDCLLKRIVEKCKSYEDMSSCYDCTWGGGLAKEILSMLEIEECAE